MRQIVGVIFAIAAFLLVMMCMPQTGAIYTHDSLSYEYAASTLVETGQMRYFGYDTPIVQWPPFYILLLSAIRLFGIPAEQGAAWINAIAFAYLLYACAIYLFNSLSSKWLSIPALILMTASVPLLLVSGYAWTEMLYTFLSVLSMVFLLQFIKKEKFGYLVAASVVSAFCWLTRYIGITMIAVLALMLVISIRPIQRKIRLTFVYLIFSCMPMALWVIRNYIISGTFTGGRQPGLYTLSDNIQLSLEVFQDWTAYITPLFTYIAAILFIILASMTFFLEKIKNNNNRTMDSYTDILAVLIYIVFYSAALLASATSTAMDPINHRLWAPIFPFWILALVFTMDLLIRNLKEEGLKNWLKAGFTVFALVAVISPVLWIYTSGFARKHTFTGQKEDIGLKYSPVAALAREKIPRLEDTLVISDDAALLTVHAGLKCYYPPKKNSIPLYSFSRYKEKMDDFRHIYIVWTGSGDPETFMNVSEFQQVYDIEKVASNNYCIIYLVKKRTGF